MVSSLPLTDPYTVFHKHKATVTAFKIQGNPVMDDGLRIPDFFREIFGEPSPSPIQIGWSSSSIDFA